jgi:hypothetical protein
VVAVAVAQLVLLPAQAAQAAAVVVVQPALTERQQRQTLAAVAVQAVLLLTALMVGPVFS